ncbi:MAG: preprotein translocase subunit SecY [Candidatus Melainabacteria bacterium]|nr:preprotein translocase subunit SecY [Candidatus Melainabacteria bacterium]
MATRKPNSSLAALSDLASMWKASGLKQKLIFTGVALAVFRLGAQIPIWGINGQAIQHYASNQLLGLLDMFSGGGLTSLSILALGIGPYITASIIMQLMTVVIPRLEELQKEEGEQGRRRISQYTRYLTVILALVQSAMVLKVFAGTPNVLLPGVEPWLFYPSAALVLVAGSLFSLWLAESITERGVGNGGSLLIFVGIISRIPFYANQTSELVSGDPQRSFSLVILLAIYLATMALIVILQLAERKIFIVSAKRQVGNKVYGGQSTYIPFKINPAGVMPIIFAFAVLAFPQTIIQFIQQSNPTGLLMELMLFYGRYLAPGTLGYIVIEFSMIVFFTFFYASIMPSMQPREIAENLKKYGSSIPGIKPGKPTADKLDEILSRITLIGAIALACVTLVASSATSLTGITTLQGLGSTALIIMVGVALDTVNQIRVHLMARHYEGFLKA